MSKKGRQQPKSRGRAKPTTSNDRRRQNRAAQDKLIGPHRHWTTSNTADRHTLHLVAECIADIAEAVTQTNLSLQADKLTTASFQRACRRISVPIRKLILSGDTQLLWRCFVPILHPMSKPASTVPMDKLTQWIGNQSITMGTAGSPDTDEFTFTTEHTTETLVNPLYGLRRTGELLYRLEELVDWSIAPIRYGQWINTKVLQVDATIITAEDLLNMMVNREGAHTELNDMARGKRRRPHRYQDGGPCGREVPQSERHQLQRDQLHPDLHIPSWPLPRKDDEKHVEPNLRRTHRPDRHI